MQERRKNNDESDESDEGLDEFLEGLSNRERLKLLRKALEWQANKALEFADRQISRLFKNS